MQRPVQDSQARGVALWVVVASGIALVGLAVRLLPSPSRDVEPRCRIPVAVGDIEGERLGCASDAVLGLCESLAPGDRVVLTPARCDREPGGMPGAMRLTVGLPLDLNRVSADELELLEGIGPKLAQTIVTHRQSHGAFASVAALDEVPGIGPATLRRLEPFLEVASEVPSRPASADP